MFCVEAEAPREEECAHTLLHASRFSMLPAGKPAPCTDKSSSTQYAYPPLPLQYLDHVSRLHAGLAKKVTSSGNPLPAAPALPFFGKMPHPLQVRALVLRDPPGYTAGKMLAMLDAS